MLKQSGAATTFNTQVVKGTAESCVTRGLEFGASSSRSGKAAAVQWYRHALRHTLRATGRTMMRVSTLCSAPAMTTPSAVSDCTPALSLTKVTTTAHSEDTRPLALTR